MCLNHSEHIAALERRFAFEFRSSLAVLSAAAARAQRPVRLRARISRTSIGRLSQRSDEIAMGCGARLGEVSFDLPEELFPGPAHVLLRRLELTVLPKVEETEEQRRRNQRLRNHPSSDRPECGRRPTESGSRCPTTKAEKNSSASRPTLVRLLARAPLTYAIR